MRKDKGPDAHDIFVSYSREDSKLVDEVVEHLRTFDLDIWRDRQEMVLGERIREKILKGIQSSSVVLVFISRHSVESPWVLGELDTAMMLEMSGDTKVVPVFLGRIADEKIPGDLRGKFSLDLRYNFQKRWLEERGTFTKTIITFAKGEDLVPRAIARPREPARDNAVGPSFNVTDVTRLYDFPPDLDGTGQCVGVVELGGGYQETDLESYMTGLGLPLPKITSVSVDGARNSPGDWGASTQVTLDL